MQRMIMFFGLWAVIIFTACESEKKEQETEVKFLVTSPVRMDTSIVRDYVSQINSINHIELRAQERGYLEKIYVDEGQFVKKGQLLFKIMPRLYEAELQSAEAEVQFAEIEYQNTKKLADSNIVAPNELAMAQAKLTKAKAEYTLAQVHLQFTEIRAPYDGILDKFHVRVGSLIDEGELLTHMSDNSQMWVYYNVPEAEYLDYRTRVTKDSSIDVQLLMANNKIFKYPGVVGTIEADFNRETGNIPFRATFPNPDGLLRHGETGNILMTIPLKNALIIPQKATYDILDKRYVFVIDEDNTVRAREIRIGAEIPHLYQVTDGLSETDKILIEGLRKVRDGDKIAIDYIEPEKALEDLHLHAE